MRSAPTVAALAVAVAVAGCSPPPVETRPGTLLIGSARVTVNDADTHTDQVDCKVAGPLTTITTGSGQSGVTALIADHGKLTAESVRIRNLGGFTGDYSAGLGSTATVTMTGRSYAISGTADGFTISAPYIRTSGTFAIDVAC